VAEFLVSQGAVLGQLDRYEEVVATCDQVVARFGEAPEPALQEVVARARGNRDIARGKLGRGAAQRAKAPCYAVSPDREWWWDGDRWQSMRSSFPADALRSPDGLFWWDGSGWNPVPR
jgi:hypothetical protein